MEFDRSLYYASAFGDLEKVQTILEGGEDDIDTQNPDNGNTPLYIAAAWGSHDEKVGYYHFEIVRLLIDYKADVNIANHSGKTPLYISSAWGHTNIVRLLIENRASLNEKANGGRTALHIAALSTPRLSQMNTRYGDYSRNHKYQAYHLAIDFMELVVGNGKYSKFLDDLDKDFQKLLSYTTAEPDEEVPDEVMDIVVYYNHFATVVELIRADAELDIRDDMGQTPLGKAAFSGHLGIVKFLADRGADINVVDRWNRKAVDIAEARNHSAVVQYLNELQNQNM